MDEHAKTLCWGWGSGFVLSCGLFCAVFFPVGHFSFQGASDACFVAGMVLLFAPLLVLIARTGVFDVLAYSFYRLFESFKAGNEKRYDTAYDFKESKKQKRSQNRPFLLPYFVYAGILLLIALVFLLLAIY